MPKAHALPLSQMIMSNFSVHNSEKNLCVFDFFRIALEEICVQDCNIRIFTGFQCPKLMFSSYSESGISGITVQCFPYRNFLIRLHSAFRLPVVEFPCNRPIDTHKRIYIDHRTVAAKGNGNISIEECPEVPGRGKLFLAIFFKIRIVFILPRRLQGVLLT